MSLDMAEDIAKQIKEDFKEKIRIDFSLHGEPMMHPNLSEFIGVFRKHLPKSQLAIISNGDLISDNTYGINELKGLFEVGLNYLMVDYYERSEGKERALIENIIGVEVKVYDYFKDNFSIWRYNSYKEKAFIIVDDLSKTNKITRKVHTAGGNLNESLWEGYGINKEDFPVYKQCSKPFTELSINADGNVSICCEDWSRVGEISNINDKKLIDIWNSEDFEKVRYLLNQKRRDKIPLCYYCNQISFRTGLYKPKTNYPELLK